MMARQRRASICFDAPHIGITEVDRPGRGGNPFLSAEWESRSTRTAVLFLLPSESPEFASISAKIKFISSVRNASFFAIITDSTRKDQFLKFFLEANSAGRP